MGLFDAFTGKPAKDAANQNNALYDQYQSGSMDDLNRGFQGGSDAIHNGIDAWHNLAGKYGAASNLYLDSLGVNGAEGNTRATGAFHAGPGYNWQVDQATDAAARRAASLGIAGSGNTMAEISNRAGNLANQEYGNWQGRLSGFVPAEQSAVGGEAGGWNSLAGLYQNDAQNRTNVRGNWASGRANSNTASANSRMQGSSQFWSGLMNLGGTAAKAAMA